MPSQPPANVSSVTPGIGATLFGSIGLFVDLRGDGRPRLAVAGEQVAVPADVLPVAHLERVLRLVAHDPAGLLHVQGAAFGHQRVALDVADADAGKLLLD